LGTLTTTPAPERTRLEAELQQLYSDGKHSEILARMEAYLPKDAAGNFIAEQERSDVVHDLLAFLAEQMLEMNKQKQQEIKGVLGWLEGFFNDPAEVNIAPLLFAPSLIAFRIPKNGSISFFFAFSLCFLAYRIHAENRIEWTGPDNPGHEKDKPYKHN